MSRYYRSILNVQQVAPALDPDAEAFLLAASITDANITDAINNLVLSLKADSLWAKMTALYPLVGGTASTHKFNLKDPRDLDAAFRLTFVGSPTHDANGVTYNGSSQSANTHLVPSTNLTVTNNHLSLYSRTDARAGYDMGAASDASIIVDELAIVARFNTGGNIDRAFYSSDGLYNHSVINTDTLGLITGTMNGTDQRLFRRSTLISNGTTAGSALTDRPIFIGAVNGGGTASFFAARNYAWNSIGNSLSDTDVTNLNTIIDTFQTALSRNV
jgi:hypothetical protein